MRPLHIGALILASCIATIASPAFAFDTSHAGHGNRIGVLLMSERVSDNSEMQAAEEVRGALVEALHKAGFDSFETGMTYDQLSRGTNDADFYVEVLSTDGHAHDSGIGTIDDGRVGADVGILVSNVAAQLRLYDGRSLELVDRFDLSKRKVAPTLRGVSIGGRHGFFSMALPWIRSAQYRGVARDVAADAATKIAKSAAMAPVTSREAGSTIEVH
jgi:hypothetical protein